jgi:hypothetical protein
MIFPHRNKPHFTSIQNKSNNSLILSALEPDLRCKSESELTNPKLQTSASCLITHRNEDYLWRSTHGCLPLWYARGEAYEDNRWPQLVHTVFSPLHQAVHENIQLHINMWLAIWTFLKYDGETLINVFTQWNLVSQSQSFFEANYSSFNQFLGITCDERD